MKAVLIINLGTPESTEVKDVRKYLKEFLSDRRVLSIPALIRYLVLRLVILPFRSKKSAAAYRKVWLSDGSPLMVYSRKLADNLQIEFKDSAKVFLAMRYGKPSIGSALTEIYNQNFTSLQVIPLFPQYSSAATGSAIEEVLSQIKSKNNFCNLQIISSFYNRPEFIDAFAKNIAECQKAFPWDYVLFSYHGLPEQHCIQSDPSNNYCLRASDCCQRKTLANTFCYRHHCFETTRLLTEKLNLQKQSFATTFQSRLGPVPWIKPYSDQHLAVLKDQGIKNLLVVSPSFVADCLETLEEIKIRLKEDWLALGGESLELVPSLNGDWAKALKSILTD